MTDRIDRAAMAASLLDQQGRWPNDRDGVNLEADRAIAEAQVHATLALVEQQRLANLIALAEHAQRRYGSYAGEAGGMGVLFSYGDTPESNMRIRDDIREALGLS